MRCAWLRRGLLSTDSYSYLRELSRRAGESEMEAYAWDLETNTMSSQKFTVKHIRDTRAGRAFAYHRENDNLTLLGSERAGPIHAGTYPGGCSTIAPPTVP